MRLCFRSLLRGGRGVAATHTHLSADVAADCLAEWLLHARVYSTFERVSSELLAGVSPRMLNPAQQKSVVLHTFYYVRYVSEGN